MEKLVQQLQNLYALTFHAFAGLKDALDTVTEDSLQLPDEIDACMDAVTRMARHLRSMHGEWDNVTADTLPAIAVHFVSAPTFSPAYRAYCDIADRNIKTLSDFQQSNSALRSHLSGLEASLGLPVYQMQLLPLQYAAILVQMVASWYDKVAACDTSEYAYAVQTVSAAMSITSEPLHPPRVHIRFGDMLKMRADVVVNTANQELREGKGICEAIFAAAKHVPQAHAKLTAICTAIASQHENGAVPTGSSVATPSFGILPGCKYIVHAVGPKVKTGVLQSSHEAKLAAAYTSVLDWCMNPTISDTSGEWDEDYARGGMQVKHVVIPCISIGIFKFPVEKARQIALKTISEWVNGRGRASTFHITLAFTDKSEYNHYLAEWPKHFSTPPTAEWTDDAVAAPAAASPPTPPPYPGAKLLSRGVVPELDPARYIALLTGQPLPNSASSSARGMTPSTSDSFIDSDDDMWIESTHRLMTARDSISARMSRPSAAAAQPRENTWQMRTASP